MKSTKPVVKSRKNLITKATTNRRLSVNTEFGETFIPIGSDDLFIQLPNLSNTYTYNIINTAEMTGAITLKTSANASMKGLMLNNSNGSISIDPIRSTTDQITLQNDIKDGSFIQTVSNGSEWFIWSVATGGTLSVRTGGINSTYSQSILSAPPDDISNVTITSNVRFIGGALEARHDLTFSGEGEPGATLTITEDGGAITPITIVVPSTGIWTVTKSTDLPNANYTFDFIPSTGNGVQNKSFIGDTGPITFTVPSAFTPDPAEVVDFAAGAAAAKPDGSIIAVTVDSTAWNSNLAHGATFNIIYSITDADVNGGVTVSQTVSGEIVDDTPPNAPVISAASIANINQLSANGTAEPNKTITLFQDSLALSPTITSDGAGAWSFGPVTLSFNSNFTLKAQASEPGVGNPNRSACGEFSPDFNHIQQQVTKPTLTVYGEHASTWTNTAGIFTLRGTTQVGSSIIIKNAAQVATLVSGPTVDGAGDWEATMNAANESITTLSAEASASGHNGNISNTFQLKVDRVAPVITLTGGSQTVGLPSVGSNLDSGFSASDGYSGVATETSNWDTQVSTTTEGVYTVTYNATDVAGNSASSVTRSVSVTTEPIIPVITNVTKNSNGSFTIEGSVTGAFSDNLTVQVTIDDSNSGTPVTVSSGIFTHTTSSQSPGTYEFKAKSINTAAQESALSSTQSETMGAVGDTTKPVITLLGNTSVSFTVGGTYSDAGATATDDVDGDVTGNIVPTIVDASGDTAILDSSTVAGTYTVRYNVSDAAGNDADRVVRTVEVLAAASFLEDLGSITTFGNAGISGGIFSRNKPGSGGAHGASFNLVDEGIVAFNSDGTRVDEELTVSFWFRPDEAWGNNWYYVGGHERGSGTLFKLAVRDNSGNLEFRAILFGGTQYKNVASASALNTSDWYHLAITYSQNASNPSNHDLKMFVNGEKVIESLDLSGNLMKMTNAVKDFAFGGYASGVSLAGNSLDHSSNSWQIVSGTALTESQVAAIAGQSDQGMSIAYASGL